MAVTESELDACGKYYLKLCRETKDILLQSFHNDSNGLHSKAHGFINDLNAWIKALSDRPENKLISIATAEYQFALLSLVMGNYRQAFMGLRMFFELSLSGIYYSAKEIDLRLIIAGKKDIHWGTIMNPEDGLFSRLFAEAFFDDLKDSSPEFATIAGGIYRECSEFTHGNPSSLDTYEPVFKYQPETFQLWHEKAKNCRTAVSYSLCLRYLKTIDSTKLTSIEDHIMDEVGFITPIRNFLGGAK